MFQSQGPFLYFWFRAGNDSSTNTAEEVLYLTSQLSPNTGNTVLRFTVLDLLLFICQNKISSSVSENVLNQSMLTAVSTIHDLTHLIAVYKSVAALTSHQWGPEVFVRSTQRGSDLENASISSRLSHEMFKATLVTQSMALDPDPGAPASAITAWRTHTPTPTRTAPTKTRRILHHTQSHSQPSHMHSRRQCCLFVQFCFYWAVSTELSKK